MEKLKSNKLLTGIVAALVAVILIAGLILNIVVLTVLGETQSMLQSSLDAQSTETKEDDVLIADEYTIKSTLAVSDAYKSGDRDKLSDKEKETLDMAAKVLDEIIDKSMSDYEKELAVYDWMVAALTSDIGSYLVVPDTQQDCDNPYGVLKFHNAVCVGYATTFRLFMQMLDIECMVVHNTELYHSWNLVNLDGEWYHTDVYSDVGVGGYSHFNLSDTMMSQDQSWDTEYFPAATGTKYNYTYMNKTVCEDIYALPLAVRAAVDNEQSASAFAFDTEIGDAEAVLVSDMMSSIEYRLNNSADYMELYMNWYWCEVDGQYILFLYIEGFMNNYFEPSEPIDIPEDAYDRIEGAVSDAFGDIEQLPEDYWDDEYWDDEWSDDMYWTDDGVTEAG